MASNEVVFLNDILLPRNPTLDMHAATKKYVDDALATAAAASHTHAAADINGLGTAALVNTGTAQGNVPVLGTGGKLPESVIPSLAITDVYTCDDEAEMLALNPQQGDIAIRTDDGKTYICITNHPEGILSDDWKELTTPTVGVTSVNGNTGAVTVNEVPSGATAGQVLMGTANGIAWTTTSYTATITGDGSAVSFQATHNLGTTDVFVQVIYTTGDANIPVIVNAVRTSSNVVTLNFAVAPASTDTFKVMIHK